jgi:hypothetical protein
MSFSTNGDSLFYLFSSVTEFCALFKCGSREVEMFLTMVRNFLLLMGPVS